MRMILVVVCLVYTVFQRLMLRRWLWEMEVLQCMR